MAGKVNYDVNSGRRLIENIRTQDWRNASIEMDQLQSNLSEPMRNIGCHLWWNALSGLNGPGMLTLQPFNVVLYDNGGFYVPSLFVPVIPPGCAGPYTITGYYRLDAPGPTAAGSVLIILVNNVAIARHTFDVCAFSSVHVSVGAYLQVGDRVDMGVYNSGAGFNVPQSGPSNIDPYSPSIRLVLNS